VKLLVYGSRTFGVVVRRLIADCGHEFAGFIDDLHPGPDVLGPFDVVRQSHPAGSFGCVNAVGYASLRARRDVSLRIAAAGYPMPSLVHPRAYVGTQSKLGAGCLVMAGSLIAENVDLGDGSVVWPGAVVSHDSVLGASVYLSPNCTICGCCRLGDCCFVGAGAVVVDHVTVPEGTRIKALERHGVPQP
jgi:sugar O-acyltransferase (sialic acid O-acetyltransferase NeuD family)